MFSAFTDLIESSFTSILLFVDSVIFWAISELYGLYLQLANVRYFTNDTISDLTDRIYIIVGVIALFLVTYALLQAIINPDDTNKNAGPGLIKRILIAIVGVTLIPVGFNFLYNFQSALLSGNVITNFFMGDNTYTEQDVYLIIEDGPGEDGVEPSSKNQYFVCDVCDETDCPLYNVNIYSELEADSQCKLMYGEEHGLIKATNKIDVSVKTQEIVGNEMAFLLLSGFLYPTPGYDPDDIGPKDPGDYFVDDVVTGASIGCTIGAVGGTVAGVIVTAGGVIASYYTSGIVAAATKVGLGILKTSASALVGCLTHGAAGAGIGVIAGGIHAGVVSATTPDNYTWTTATSDMINNGAFTYIAGFSDSVVDGSLTYHPFISGIAGGFMFYMIFSFCLDLGIRAIKLAFLQLIAPVPFFLSILPKNKDLISNWVKITLSTFAEVFVRIGCLTGAAYFIKFLNTDALDGLPSIGQAIIIMGIIAFARQLPKLFGEITGIKGDGLKLGIKDKLAAGGAFTAAAAAGGLATTALRTGVSHYKANKDNWKNLDAAERRKIAGKAFGDTLLSAGSGLVRGGYAARNAKTFTDIATGAGKGATGVKKAKYRRQLKKERHERDGTNTLHDMRKSASRWVGYDSDLETLESDNKVYQEVKTGLEKVKSTAATAMQENVIAMSAEYAKEVTSGTEFELNKSFKDLEMINEMLKTEKFDSSKGTTTDAADNIVDSGYYNEMARSLIGNWKDIKIDNDADLATFKAVLQKAQEETLKKGQNFYTSISHWDNFEEVLQATLGEINNPNYKTDAKLKGLSNSITSQTADTVRVMNENKTLIEKSTGDTIENVTKNLITGTSSLGSAKGVIGNMEDSINETMKEVNKLKSAEAQKNKEKSGKE